MDASNWSLSKWFTLVDSSSIVLPRFQRHEAWAYGQVQGLLNTVLSDLPCGALLTLEKGDSDPFVARPLKTAPESDERVTHYLLDGQQRLTALWRALHNNYDDRTYFLSIATEESPVRIVSEGRYMRNNQRFPLWVDQPVQVWNRGLIPLDLLCPGSEAEARVPQWRQSASAGDDSVGITILEHVAKWRAVVATFNIPVLSLPRTTNPETALDVFVKMNTSASPLTTYDIMVAQIEAATGESLHDLVAELKQQVPQISEYYSPSKLVLYVTSLMLDRPSSQATQKSSEFARSVIKNFDTIIRGARRAVIFLEQERLFDDKRMPTDVVIPALVYLWATTPEGLDIEGHASALMRRYVWRAFCTRRYENSTATKVHADVRLLAKLIRDPNTEQPEIFDRVLYPIAEIEELEMAKWPVKRDRLARSVLAIALRFGARDFADDQVASRENLKKREYHHIFPRQWLKDAGISSEKKDLALNCALISMRTNRNIAAKAPETYLEERLQGGIGNDRSLRERLDSHGISLDSVKNEDYDQFINERALLIHEAMMMLCDPDVVEESEEEAA